MSEALAEIGNSLGKILKIYISSPKEELRESIKNGISFYHSTANSLNEKLDKEAFDLKPLLEPALEKAIELFSKYPSFKTFTLIETLVKLIDNAA